MKRLLKAGFASTLLGLTSVAVASPTIELKDGSRIQGDVQSIEHGVYTVNSPSLGTVRIPQDKVARIEYGGSANRTESSSHNDEMVSQALQMQQRLAQDPDAMKSIMSLQSDPQVQAILSDPAIMGAIQRGDYMSLLDNDKIKALESNPQLRQLLQQEGQ